MSAAKLTITQLALYVVTASTTILALALVGCGGDARVGVDNPDGAAGTRDGGSGGAVTAGSGGAGAGGAGGTAGSGGATGSGGAAGRVGTGGAGGTTGTGGAAGRAGTGGSGGGAGLNTIACRSTVCNALSEACCLTPPPETAAAPATCTPVTGTCPGPGCTCPGVPGSGYYVRPCDGPEDCGAGAACCSGDFPWAPGCRPGTTDCGVNFPQFCHTATDCPAARPHCCPSTTNATELPFCSATMVAGCT
jgi:hypothetical protein